MSRARLARIAGVVLLVAAFVLPCLQFINVAVTPMPFQDPTPDMVKKQAAEIAAAEQQLAVAAIISGVLAVCGLAALIYARKQQRLRNAAVET